MRAGISPNTIPWEREAIEVFAKTRNAASYRHWMQENLCQIDPRFDFEQAFRDATTQAGTIHFNLDGFNLRRGVWVNGLIPTRQVSPIGNSCGC